MSNNDPPGRAPRNPAKAGLMICWLFGAILISGTIWGFYRIFENAAEGTGIYIVMISLAWVGFLIYQDRDQLSKTVAGLFGGKTLPSPLENPAIRALAGLICFLIMIGLSLSSLYDMVMALGSAPTPTSGYALKIVRSVSIRMFGAIVAAGIGIALTESPNDLQEPSTTPE